jgi:hypothetical protein
MEIRFHSTLAELPEDAGDIWRSAEKESVFLSRWWFEALMGGALDAGDRIAIASLHDDRQALALIPCRFVASAGLLGGRRLHSITGMYSCLFRPLIGGTERQEFIAHALGRELGRALRRGDAIHLDAMASDWSAFGAFKSGLREAGFIAMPYDHFGNWSEPLAGASFQQYISRRGGALQEILRRKGRDAARSGVEFRIVSAPDDVDAGIADYESVYRRSWKAPEPYPNFLPLLMRQAAAAGALRLGICAIAGQPAAVQLWTAWHGTATIMKLAHDEALVRLSAGSLLTAHMIQALMQRDGIKEIDFGRGDDAYKLLWASRRRQRIGLIAANPRSLTGLFHVAKQALPMGLGLRGNRARQPSQPD